MNRSRKVAWRKDAKGKLFAEVCKSRCPLTFAHLQSRAGRPGTNTLPFPLVLPSNLN